MACAWSRVLPTHSTPRAARPGSQVTLIKRSAAHFLQISGSNEEINEAGKASIKSKSCSCSITEFWAAKGAFAFFPINFLGRARHLRDVAKEFWIQAQPHQNLTSSGEKALQSGQNSGNIWPLGCTWHSASGSFWQTGRMTFFPSYFNGFATSSPSSPRETPFWGLWRDVNLP